MMDHKADVYRAYARTSWLLTIDDKERFLQGTDEHQILGSLKSLEKVCSSLSKGEKPIFRCTNTNRLNCTQLGEQFLEIIRPELLEKIDSLFPEYRCHPYIKAAMDQISQLNVGYYTRYLNLYAGTAKMRDIVNKLNDLVSNIRSQVRSDGMKRTLRNYRRNATKTRRELNCLVNGLFARYAKVLVVRLDLSYKKTASLQLEQQNINHTDVRGHLRSLLKLLKTKLFKENLISYAWKLEYGPIKGYHFHTFFFFDGSKLKGDIDLANMIGKQWSGEITDGSGAFFNCNRIKDAYEQLGIGMIDHRDTDTINNLKNNALEYLVKVDYYVKTIADSKIRTFGRGVLPKQRAKPRGRPRGSMKAIAKGVNAGDAAESPFKRKPETLETILARLKGLGVHGDAAHPFHDFIDAPRGYADAFGQCVLADAHGFEAG